MAKTVNFVFCGKEMTRGMFSGDAASLELSKHTLVDCCDECRAKYEKEFSFKPAITKMSFAGTGLFPHTQRKRAKAMCEAALVALAIAIGSDISVEYVNKFN